MDPSKGIQLAILQVQWWARVDPSKGVHLAGLSGTMVGQGGSQ